MNEALHTLPSITTKDIMRPLIGLFKTATNHIRMIDLNDSRPIRMPSITTQDIMRPLIGLFKTATNHIRMIDLNDPRPIRCDSNGGKNDSCTKLRIEDGV